MKIVISSTSSDPIYAQIEAQIREAIASGELTDGDALPSLRRLARDLRVSVLTVTRAYTELADEGLISNEQGRGSFVKGGGGEMIRQQAVGKVREAMSSAVTLADDADMSPQELHGVLDELLAERHATGNPTAVGERAAQPSNADLTSDDGNARHVTAADTTVSNAPVPDAAALYTTVPDAITPNAPALNIPVPNATASATTVPTATPNTTTPVTTTSITVATGHKEES